MHARVVSPIVALGVVASVALAGCGPNQLRQPTSTAQSTTTTSTAGTGTSDLPELTAPSQGAAVVVTQLSASLAASPRSVKAGEVTFKVNNSGVEPSSFTVVKTQKAADGLPLKGDVANLSADGIDLIGQVTPLGAGATQSVTLKLNAGRYVLLSNAPGQYQAGVASAFTVTQS